MIIVQFIEEIVVEQFLPTVRSMLVEELSRRGLTQQEIAASIGVSQSAVSKYVHGEVERAPDIERDPHVRQRIEDIADALETEAMDPVGVLVELEVLIRELEAPGQLLARLHEQTVPALANRDDMSRVHDPDSQIRTEERVRSSVQRAIRHIERSPRFVELLPQVGANVVEALPEATTIDEVIGIPGRIIDVEGRVEIPGSPAAGVSGHLASVLLAARDAGSKQMAAINIAYDTQFIETFRQAGNVIAEIPGDERTTDAVNTAITQTPDATVIVQPGAVGIEPIIYHLGPDAPTVVATVQSLLLE